METNKKITEEKIIEAVDKAILRQTEENLHTFLVNSIDEYSEKLKGKPILNQCIVELATMSTAIKISTLIIKEALIELLCED